MDGTFKYCPKFFQQLHTIHGYKNGNYIPLVFVTKQIRGNVFKMFFFLNKTVQIWDFRLPLKSFILIFEESFMKVMRNYFPSILIKSCRFHLAQAW